MTEMTQEELENIIQNIIQIRIRPVLQAHGGDIVYKEFKEGIVYVELQGSCQGCPGAVETLKGNVEHFLKILLPEIKAVQDINMRPEEESEK